MSDHPIINDPAFEIIPKNSTFFLIWRIEKFELVPISKPDYGKFFNGDAYIVACGIEFKGKADSEMEPKRVTGEAVIHIHFWIGSKATIDEAGVAAIKAMQMDDYMGGSPIQHRETEGYESQRFLSYFKKGIRVLVGGVASGFKKVELIEKPTLFHVKGKRNPIVKQLYDINWLPFNDGDIFILTTGKYLFLWTGKHANNLEKINAMKIAQEIKFEHKNIQTMAIVDDEEELMDLSADELEAFEEFLPLSKKCVDSYDPKEDESKYETMERSDIVLYRCSEENGSLKMNKVKNGPLVKSDLQSDDTFIVDNHDDGIWVWVGKKASRQEKSGSMKYALELIKINNYSQNTRITKVIESTEHIEFKSLFKSWTIEKPNVSFARPYTRVSKVTKQNFNPIKLKENQKLSAKTQLVDNGNGEKIIYYLENSELLALKPEDYGKFYKQNCYVVVYKYNKNDVIIYYWLGSNSTTPQRNTCESKAIEMDRTEYSGQSVLVRVIECGEPMHLTVMFNGLMTIFNGKYPSDNNRDKYLLQVKGTTEYNSKLVEVDCNAVSLNSNCVFFLSLPGTNYIWAGNNSLDDKKEMARKLAIKDSSKETQSISEGKENDEFWAALEGQKSYDSTRNDKLIHDFKNARLFQRTRGKYEEVVQYDQNALNEDEIVILDAFDVVFVWLGNKIKDIQKINPIKIAENYIKSDATIRQLDLPIYVVKESFEPTNFTGYFPSWDKNHWNKTDNFNDMKREMRKIFMKKFPTN